MASWLYGRKPRKLGTYVPVDVEAELLCAHEGVAYASFPEPTSAGAEVSFAEVLPSEKYSESLSDEYESLSDDDDDDASDESPDVSLPNTKGKGEGMPNILKTGDGEVN